MSFAGSRALLLLIAFSLLLGIQGCHGPKTLETRIGTHKTESLVAEAEWTGDCWQVSLVLPAGNWKVEPVESQSYEMIAGDPRATLRWSVTPGRWANFKKPFVFELAGEGGIRIPLTVRYPRKMEFSASEFGQKLLLFVITGFTNSNAKDPSKTSTEAPSIALVPPPKIGR